MPATGLTTSALSTSGRFKSMHDALKHAIAAGTTQRCASAPTDGRQRHCALLDNIKKNKQKQKTYKRASSQALGSLHLYTVSYSMLTR